MSYMLYGCSSLKSLNLLSFNTSLVKRMNSMFSQCVSLISLDLSSFNISSLDNMINMFNGDIKLEYFKFYRFTGNKNWFSFLWIAK